MNDQGTRRLFELAVEQAYDSVVITTAELDPPGPTIVYVNDAFCRTTGYSREELIGATPRILQGPRTDRTELDRLRANLEAGERFEGSTINYRKDGSPYLVRWNISPLREAEGAINYFVSVQRDTTHEVELEHFNQALLESLGEGVFGIDDEGRFTFLNAAALNILGYRDAGDLMGQSSHELTHYQYPDGTPYPETECPIYQVMRSGEALYGWRDHFFKRDGNPIPVEASATPLWEREGGIFGGVVVFRDISEQRRLEEELEHQAMHDPLTGTYNRHFCDNLLVREVDRVERHPEPLALLMLDIDYFKAINDAHGHLVGDRVLKRLAQAIQGGLRSMDTLARWGGEEFLVILPNTAQEGALQLGERLRSAVAETDFGDDVGAVRVSIGAGERQEGEALRDWLERIDEALYRAKEAGRNRVEPAE